MRALRLGDPHTSGGKTVVSAIGCTLLPLPQQLGHIPTPSPPRASGALSTESTALLGPQRLAPVPRTCSCPRPGRLALPWPRAQRLSRSPAGMLTTHRRGLTGAGAMAHKLTDRPGPAVLPLAPGCSPEAALPFPFCPGNSWLQGSCASRSLRAVLNIWEAITCTH